MSARHVESLLEGCANSLVLVEPRLTWEALGLWRKAYWRGDKRGIDQYDWHAFSYDRFPHLSGSRALAAARACLAGEPLVALSARKADEFAFLVHTHSIPDLSLKGVDVSIGPADWRWTLTFTHESDLGPYFATAAT